MLSVIRRLPHTLSRPQRSKCLFRQRLPCRATLPDPRQVQPGRLPAPPPPQRVLRRDGAPASDAQQVLGGPRPGKTPAPIVQVASAVTPRRHRAGATVLDQHPGDAGHPTAMGGGDVVGTHQIPMPHKVAVRTSEVAVVRLGDPLPAARAGGGAAPLIHQHHPDPRQLGLVPQRLDQMHAAPVAQPQVVAPAPVPPGDALGIADQQGADPVVDGEGDHRAGGLMVGLTHPAAMAHLCAPLRRSVLTPAPGAALPRLGRPAGSRAGAGFAVGQVQVVLGADRPARHQQPGAVGGDRVGDG
jgi:hypothetical protein